MKVDRAITLSENVKNSLQHCAMKQYHYYYKCLSISCKYDRTIFTISTIFTILQYLVNMTELVNMTIYLIHFIRKHELDYEMKMYHVAFHLHVHVRC